MPELLGRREIGLPSAVAKINEVIAKHLHMRGFVRSLQSAVRVFTDRVRDDLLLLP